MQKIVFYSWQSDLPNATNRGFIQTALEAAAAAIAGDKSVAIEPVVDRDVQGTSGSPDIAATIFAKITAADVFVADVSITCRPVEGRVAPNPNVLLELGYAYKAVGHERVILVLNKTFGGAEELPFDLRSRLVVIYEMAEASKERATERKTLQSKLEVAIREALKHIPKAEEETAIPAATAIESGAPGRVLAVRRNLEEIYQRLKALAPPNYTSGGRVPDTEAALDKSQEVVAEFGKIAEVFAVLGDKTVIPEFAKFFALVFEQFENSKGFTGTSSNADHDYMRFLGYEMFLMLVASLLRESKWVELEKLLEEPFILRYYAPKGTAEDVTWSYAFRTLPSFVDESRARSRQSLQADILKARHDSGGLAAVSSFDDLMTADLFLYLCCAVSEERQKRSMRWYPVTGVFMSESPRFLHAAANRSVAGVIARILGERDIEKLKEKLLKLDEEWHRKFFSHVWRSPLDKSVVEKIGTQGLGQIVG